MDEDGCCAISFNGGIGSAVVDLDSESISTTAPLFDDDDAASIAAAI